MGKSPSRTIFSSQKNHKRGCLLYLFLLVLILAAVFTVNAVNNSRVYLREQKITVSALPERLEKFRILHISDLHASRFGIGQKNLYAAIRNRKYDAVCMTGDMVGISGNAIPFLELIDLIPEDIPIFFIGGDNDPEAVISYAHGSATVLADYILQGVEHGAVYLDAPYKVIKGKSTIWFSPESVIGLDLPSSMSSLQKDLELLNAEDLYHPDNAAKIRADQYRLEVIKKIESAQDEMKNEDVLITLAHQPLNVNTLRTLQQWAGTGSTDFLKKTSLILSGHYNNGQVRFPFIGAIYVPASSGLGNHGWFPDNSLISGYSQMMGVAQYISPGLGVSGAYPYLPLRLFNAPTVTLIELTSKMTDTGV